MTNKEYYSVVSKIELIEKTTQLIHQLKSLKEAPLAVTLQQYEKRKQKLIKELLVEMISAGISFSQCEATYLKLFSYLKANEQTSAFSAKLKKDMRHLEGLLIT